MSYSIKKSKDSEFWLQTKPNLTLDVKWTTDHHAAWECLDYDEAQDVAYQLDGYVHTNAVLEWMAIESHRRHQALSDPPTEHGDGSDGQNYPCPACGCRVSPYGCPNA